MKHLLTAAFLFISFFASAQNVNIPDANFKQLLLDYTEPVIDTNGDGEIQESEAQAVTNLYLTSDFQPIANLIGIKFFTNLDTLVTDNILALDSIDLSGMTSLRQVGIGNSKIHSVNISNCSNLTDAWVDNITVYDSVSNLNITGDHRLKTLYFGELNLQELDLRQCDSLSQFTMGTGNIQYLNVSGLAKLEKLAVEGHIGALNAVNDVALQSILGAATSSDGIYIDDLFVTNCSSLERLELIMYSGHTLDFSTCPKLWSTGINSPNLRYLNVKNGNTVPTIPTLSQHLGIYILDNPSPSSLYVCTNDFETSDIINALIQQNGPTAAITANSFCSVSPGGNFNTIQGKIRVDVDNNGCDNADEEIANVPVRVFDGTYYTMRYSTVSGDYRHYGFAGNFSLTPYFPYPYFTIGPATANIVFDTANNLIDTLDFCITPNGVHNELDITFLPVGGARPGFIAHYQMVYRNRGTTTLSGNAQVNFDAGKMHYLYSSVAVSSQSAGLLNWNYNNLLPLQSRYIDVYFSILPPPVNNMGDTLTYLATINPSAADETPADNSFILPQRESSSYDPNEKTCLEGDKLDIAKIGDYLHYIIHFQNTGTDTAFTVVVTDTLTNNLDWESFDYLGSSHPCNVKRVDNKLEFYFQNIKLPYQAINDAGSNGFIAYTIKPKSTLVAGDSVNNTASIYFDFNPPILTNKTTTIVGSFSPVPVKLEYFSLSSKDESNLLTWKIATTDLSTDFSVERSSDGIHFNNIGNITATTQRCQLPFYFTDDKPIAGKNYYRIKITAVNSISFYSEVLVTGKTKSGLEITAITSDQDNTILYMNVSKDQTVQMKIIAADGKMIYSQSKTITAGTGQMNLQLKNISKGVYTLIIYTSDGEVLTKRFIK